MTSGIDIVGGTGSAASVVAPASTASASSSAATATSSATSSTSIDAVIVRSPKIIGDPTAGFITQYLSTNGEVVSQVPSAVAVAYLRGGLAADGSPKHGAVAEPLATA